MASVRRHNVPNKNAMPPVVIELDGLEADALRRLILGGRWPVDTTSPDIPLLDDIWSKLDDVYQEYCLENDA